MSERTDLIELEQRIERGLRAQALAYTPGRRTVTLQPSLSPRRSSSWRPVLIGLSVICAVAVAVGAWVVIAQPRESSELTPSDLSVREVYRRVERAITRPGFAYHQTESLDGYLGDQHQTVETWVELRRNVAREQYRPPNLVTLIANGLGHSAIRTDSVDTGVVSSCPGASSALSAIVTCPEPSLHPSQRVATGTFNGRPAVVLVTKTNPDAPAGQPVRTRLYLDAKTFLPIAAQVDQDTTLLSSNGTETTTVTRHVRVRSTYRHDFVSIEDLPTDFYTAASIEAWATAQ